MSAIMENQMEERIENGMGTVLYWGYRDYHVEIGRT